MLTKKYGIFTRFVEEEDAEFIYSLRQNELLGRFLSKTDSDIEKQKLWIKSYKQREAENKEFYFISIGISGDKYGVSRIYNLNEDSFESGSWIFTPSAPIGVSILTDLISRDYGYETLGFSKCRFEVRKRNVTVVNYSKRFNPTLINEDNLNFYYELSYENYKIQREKLLRMFIRNTK